MSNFNPKDKPFGKDHGERSSDGFHREDSDRREGGYTTSFNKDKRTRTGTKRVEKISREPRPDYPRHDREEGGERQRRSFNPNFTPDNRPVNDDKPRRDYGSRPDHKPYEKKEWKPRPPREGEEGRREWKPRTERSGDSGPKRDWNSNDRKDWKPRPPREGEEGRREWKPRTERSGDSGPKRDWNSNDRKEWKPRPPREGEEGRREWKPRTERNTGSGRDWNSGDRGSYKPRPQRDEDFNRYDNERGPKRDWKSKDRGEWKPKGDKRPFNKTPRDPKDYPKFAAPKLDKPVRLNRYIAMSGICSRREADDFITAGVVTVNGMVVTELGTKISPTDEVRFNDNIVRGEKKVYIVMNKPKGFVTTLEDPHADKTVMDLIKGAVTERVYPVGRLDKNSVGVLLITNDGDLTKRLTHPGYMKKKIYQVSLDKPLTRADMERIAEGIELEDGPIKADDISYVKENFREVGIEIHSGRNRIVRRIFEHLNYKVQKLDRVYFAGLTKKALKRGAWRFLTPKEVAMLKSGEYE